MDPEVDHVVAGITRRAARVAGQVAHDDYAKRERGERVTHSASSTAVMDVWEDGEAPVVPVVVIERLGKGPVGHQLWGGTCPLCLRTFHRTSEAVARSWMDEHLARWCPSATV